MFAHPWKRRESAHGPGRRRLKPGVEAFESRRLLSGVAAVAVPHADSSDPGIRSAATSVEAALSAAVLARTSTPTADSGLTIDLPGPLIPGDNAGGRGSAVNAAYANHAAFDAATGWSAFLRSFVVQPEVDRANLPPEIGSLSVGPGPVTPGPRRCR
jgi:hypothetical protein